VHNRGKLVSDKDKRRNVSGHLSYDKNKSITQNGTFSKAKGIYLFLKERGKWIERDNPIEFFWKSIKRVISAICVVSIEPLKPTIREPLFVFTFTIIHTLRKG
jgi:transposase